MKATGDLDDNRLLRTNAANLAAYLSFLSTRHPAEYQLILKTVQLVAAVCSRLPFRTASPEPQDDQTGVESQILGRLF